LQIFKNPQESTLIFVGFLYGHILGTASKGIFRKQSPTVRYILLGEPRQARMPLPSGLKG
jgi:hypothetical protein